MRGGFQERLAHIRPGTADRQMYVKIASARGGQPIKGKVFRIDPAGLLKIAALGIEEQRVRVTIDRSSGRLTLIGGP